MGKSFFNRLETSSTQEREHIAAELKKLYNCWYQEENEAFQAQRTAKNGLEYNDAQKRHVAAISKLGAIQAVFAELGIEFEGLYDMED